MVNPISYPSLSVGPSGFSWKLKTLTQTFSSPLTGKTQTQDMGAAKWMCVIDYATLSRADLSLMSSFLAQLNGEQGRVFIPPFHAINPRGTAQTALGATNFIRNNTMVGAVVGSPGTVPTNWTSITTVSGISRSISTVSTETLLGTASVPFIDIRWNGTTTAAGNIDAPFETSTGISGVSGQQFTESFYYKLAAGSLSNVSTVFAKVLGFDSAGTTQTESFSSNITNPDATQRRATFSPSLANVSTAHVRPTFGISWTGTGVVIDVTIRIYLPQLELGAIVTPPIKTIGSSVFRPSGPYINGANQSGVSLNTGGWASNGSGLLVPGDFFGYGAPKGNSLKITTQSVSSDLFGNAAISFVPRIRSIPSDQTAITLNSPTCAMKLVDDTSNLIDIQPPIVGTIQLSFVEAIPT